MVRRWPPKPHHAVDVHCSKRGIPPKLGACHGKLHIPCRRFLSWPSLTAWIWMARCFLECTNELVGSGNPKSHLGSEVVHGVQPMFWIPNAFISTGREVLRGNVWLPGMSVFFGGGNPSYRSASLFFKWSRNLWAGNLSSRSDPSSVLQRSCTFPSTFSSCSISVSSPFNSEQFTHRVPSLGLRWKGASDGSKRPFFLF